MTCLLRSVLDLEAPVEEEGEGPFLGEFCDYEIEERIGSGGMGTVFRARQVSLDRKVAVKLLHSGSRRDPGSRIRLLAEAETAATLEHPGIIPVYEVGDWEGQTYFAMRLMECGHLAERKVDPSDREARRQAVARMIKIARAVQYAHERGVLHRDLKPSNILLGRDGEPVVSDFGLAHRVEGKSRGSLTGAILGTPAYMAPEQASGEDPITTATDVHGLGALLYHQLTGCPPFAGGDTLDVLKHVQFFPPADFEADPDLKAICVKCLAKAPGARYASAAALAEDLECWLRGEPVEARPLTPGQRVVKWARRHPALAGLGMVSVAAVVSIAVLVAVSNRNLAHERNIAQEAEATAVEAKADIVHGLARSHAEEAEMFFAKAGNPEGFAHLAQALRLDPANRAMALRLYEALDKRRVPVPYGPSLEAGTAVKALHVSRDGGKLFAVTPDARVLSWDLTTWKRLPEIRHDGGRLRAFAFSPDDSRVAMLGDDGRLGVFGLGDGTVTHSGGIFKDLVALDFSPDSLALLTLRRDGTAGIWDIANSVFRNVRRLEIQPLGGGWDPYQLKVYAVGGFGHVAIWDVRAGQVETLQDYVVRTERQSEIDVQVGRRNMLMFTSDSRAILVNSTNSIPVRSFGHRSHVNKALFSPPGDYLAVAADDHTAQLWHIDTGQPALPRMEHTAPVVDLGFSRDAKRMLTRTSDSHVTLWNFTKLDEAQSGIRADEGLETAVFLADNHEFVTATSGGTLQCWRLPESSHEWKFDMVLLSSTSVAKFLPDGERCFFDTDFSESRIVVRGKGGWEPGDWAVLTMPWLSGVNADGSRVGSVVDQANFLQWDSRTAKEVDQGLPLPSRPKQMAFSPSNPWLVAFAYEDGGVAIWDLQVRETMAVPVDTSREIARIAFSGDGRLLACGGIDGRVEFWDVSAASTFGVSFSLAHEVSALAMSPDGERVAVGSRSGEVEIREVRTGKLLLAASQGGTVTEVIFSPSGSRVASGAVDKTARVWEVGSGMPAGPALAGSDAVDVVRFAGEARLLTGSRDGWVRLWDIGSGLQIGEPLPHGGDIRDLDVSGNGQFVATAAAALKCYIFELPGMNGQSVAPDWLPEFAEAIGGWRLTGKDVLEPLSRARRLEIVRAAAGRTPGEPIAKLARLLAEQVLEAGLR